MPPDCAGQVSLWASGPPDQALQLQDLVLWPDLFQAAPVWSTQMHPAVPPW